MYPRPSDAELEAAYRAGMPHEDKTLEVNPASALDVGDVKVAHLLSLPLAPGRLLDVGCGSGHLLHQARLLGWEPHGVDPTEQQITAARQGYGLADAHLGAVEDLDYPAGHFDVVALTAVIEHLRDPEATLRHIHHMLRPGGFLVLQTDNLESLSSLVLRRRWPFFIPPFHLQNFTPSGLRALVERAGYEVVRSWTPRDIEPIQLHTRLGLPLSAARLLFAALTPVRALVRTSGRGELIALTARRS